MILYYNRNIYMKFVMKNIIIMIQVCNKLKASISFWNAALHTCSETSDVVWFSLLILWIHVFNIAPSLHPSCVLSQSNMIKLYCVWTSIPWTVNKADMKLKHINESNTNIHMVGITSTLQFLSIKLLGSYRLPRVRIATGVIIEKFFIISLANSWWKLLIWGRRLKHSFQKSF